MEGKEANSDAESDSRACNMSNPDNSPMNRNKKYLTNTNKSPKNQSSEGTLIQLFNRMTGSFFSTKSSTNSNFSAGSASETNVNEGQTHLQDSDDKTAESKTCKDN